MNRTIKDLQDALDGGHITQLANDSREPELHGDQSFASIFDAYQHPSVYLVTGKPRKGKTHMIKSLILDKTLNEDIKADHRLSFGLVFCSEASIHEYSGKRDTPGLIPKKYCIEGYKEDKLVQYLSFLKKRYDELGDLPRSFVLFDDLVGLLDSNSSAFTSFITCHRKYNVDVLLSVQYLKKNISPTIRECVSYAIMFNSKTELTIKALFESFGELAGKYEDFKRLFFRQTREQYTAMLFIELNETTDENYLSIKAPAEVPDVCLTW